MGEEEEATTSGELEGADGEAEGEAEGVAVN